MAVGPPPEELHLSQRPQIEGSIPGQRTRELLDKQAEIEANTVAYPRSIPIAMDAARGATIRDVDGNVYLDFFGGIGVANVGHSNPYVLEAAQEQLDSLAHTIDFPTEARIEFLEAVEGILPGTLPGNCRIAFGGPTGTNAIEASIKLARYNTENEGLLAFDQGYHGGTAGALRPNSGRIARTHTLGGSIDLPGQRHSLTRRDMGGADPGIGRRRRPPGRVPRRSARDRGRTRCPAGRRRDPDRDGTDRGVVRLHPKRYHARRDDGRQGDRRSVDTFPR